jgi:hypothetical protein
MFGSTGALSSCFGSVLFMVVSSEAHGDKRRR